MKRNMNMEIRKIRLIDIEWNFYNGFSFDILDVEMDIGNRQLESALFAINIYNYQKLRIWIDLLYFSFDIHIPFIN